jgi:hypothetical protein
MDKALLLFGTLIIFFGILFFYLLLTSAIDMAQSVKDQYSTLPQVKKNQINISALISATIILIGVLIVREAFKR